MICRVNGLCNEKCDKHCILTTGGNLVKFLREIDVVESRIGELSNEKGRPAEFIVSGMQLDITNNPAHTLSDISTPLDASKKFSPTLNKTATAILNEYIRISQIEDGPELKDRLHKIETNKLLVTPIKPGMDCSVVTNAEDKDKGKEVVKNTAVGLLKWVNNKQTNTLEYYVITDVIDGISSKRAKVNIEDYGEKIRLTDIERSVSSSDVDHSVIKITRFGFIRPVAILDKKRNGLVIDNTYLYLVDGENVKTIAYWDRNGLKGEDIYSEITKTVTFKKLKKNIDYIRQHRRFIAPYGLVECNIIEV